MVNLLSAFFNKSFLVRGIFPPSRLQLDFYSFEKGMFLYMVGGEGCHLNSGKFEEEGYYLCQGAISARVRVNM